MQRRVAVTSQSRQNAHDNVVLITIQLASPYIHKQTAWCMKKQSRHAFAPDLDNVLSAKL